MPKDEEDDVFAELERTALEAAIWRELMDARDHAGGRSESLRQTARAAAEDWRDSWTRDPRD